MRWRIWRGCRRHLLLLHFRVAHRAGIHKDEFPDMPIRVLEPMPIHKPVVLWLVVSGPARGYRAVNHLIHLRPAFTGQAESTSVLCVAPQIFFGVNSLNFSSVRSITKMLSAAIMQVAVSSVNCRIELKAEFGEEFHGIYKIFYRQIHKNFCTHSFLL